MKLSLITCSYAPDFERCRLLCRSVDRFVDGFAEHVLIVPRRDRALFSQLLGPGRTMVEAESLLPSWLGRVPGSSRWWWSMRSLPVRGWIVQQVVKFSAFSATDADGVVFVDSDVQYVRDFSPSDVMRDGLLRLHRVPDEGKKPFHLKWNLMAGELLGVTPRDYYGADYIGQLVSWRRDHTQALHRRLEEVGSADWRATLCRTLHFSEYILYGVFVDHVLEGRPGHYPEERDLCHCSWHHGEKVVDEKVLQAFLDRLQPHHAAVLVQSNLGLDEAQCDEWIARRRESAGAAGPLATVVSSTSHS